MQGQDELSQFFLGSNSGGRLSWSAAYWGVEYPGEIITARQWDPAWGNQLPPGTYFRLVLLAEPQRAPMRLGDPRIAVCVPHAPGHQEGSRRQLHQVREAKAVYRAGPDRGLQDLLGPLEAQEHHLLGEVLHQQAADFSAGRIVGVKELRLDPKAVFNSPVPREWADTLARALLSHAYPRALVDLSSCPRPLASGDVAQLFDALFAPVPTSQAQETLACYGPGLGLTLPEFAGCLPLQLVTKEFTRARASGLPLPAKPLIDTLANDGLPPPLPTLYLMAFVARNSPPVELGLRQGHHLQTRDGKPFPGDRLTWDLLSELAWAEDSGEAMETLRSPSQPSWRTVLPYARLVNPGLLMDPSPAEEEAQQGLLMESLQNLGRGTARAREALHRLEVALSQPSPSELLTSLDRLKAITGAQDASAFCQGCRTVFAGLHELRQALRAYQATYELALVGDEIIDAYVYLDAIHPGPGHRQVALDRDLLLAQLNLAALAASPGLWPGIRAQVAQFISSHRERYMQHHTAHHGEAADLHTRLQEAAASIEALGLLNTIPELGRPLGTDLPQRHKELTERVKPCPVQEAELPLAFSPVCLACSLSLSEQVPRQEVETHLAALRQALQARSRRLTSRAMQAVLRQPGTELVDRLIKLAQVSDLSALAKVLDREVVEFLRSFLHQP
ncbi:MAG: hypothetical protein HY686_00255 [Chloroflexi bacterium]|nr:hypothetical protein [Chloroflexota bacterium]